MSEEDSWEARMAARARQRAGQRGEVDPRIPDVCAVCGVRGDPRLWYGNMHSGARYCSEDHLKHDPDWSDDNPWMAAEGNQP